MSFGWQPVLTWTKDTSWPLNQCLRPNISEAFNKIGGQGAGEVNNFIRNYTEVEDHGDKCRKCSVEHQRGTHIVNSKFNLFQNVKMRQGCEFPGNHLRHDLWFKFKIKVYFYSTAHVCKFISEH